MGKPKQTTAKAKAKAKPEKKKATGAAKPSAEQMSDQTRQTLLFQHKRKLKPLLAAEKMAKDAVRKQYEIAKKEGITKKEIEIAFLLETEEGQEKVKAQVQRILDVDRWMGKEIGTQLDMFTKESSAERHFDEGKRAALDDQPCKPPSHLSQAASQHWMDGHAKGRELLNVQRAEGFRPLSDVVGGIVPPNGGGEQHQQAA